MVRAGTITLGLADLIHEVCGGKTTDYISEAPVPVTLKGLSKVAPRLHFSTGYLSGQKGADKKTAGFNGIGGQVKIPRNNHYLFPGPYRHCI